VLVLALLFLGIFVGALVDLLLDAPESWLTPHVILEVSLLALTLGVSLFLWRGWAHSERSLERVRRSLAEREAEREMWRRGARSMLAGLGREIDRQFHQWGLTPAEREVSLLLIKGFSHKDIATLTGRSERTTRQHAGSAYRKAGLAGRAELAAYFLEDLLLPEEEPRNEAGGGPS
jgi:DNA-binding NarL/FixJ family response regulator